MEPTVEKLRSILVDPGHMDKDQFELAAKEAEIEGKSLEQALVEKGLISDEHLGQMIADTLECHFADLKKIKISNDLLDFIPEIVARSQRVIVFEKDKDTLKIATSRLGNYEFVKLLERKSGYNVEVYYATPLGIESALNFYKSELGGLVKKIIRNLETDPQSEGDVVKLVDLFLEYAHDNRASDIHIEPLDDQISVRFRIDGVLHEIVTYPKSLHDKVVFRVKIMSRLRTDEHAAAQDGRFDYTTQNTRFDVRVSVLPVTDGENVVMRLLTERSRKLGLEELGLLGLDLEKVKRAASRPYGMILVVGPTGSGKTTTLYAVLQILNRPEVNIMTIEDPVEYDIEHIQQTQVNPKKNLTFATGLRSIVRQDPDIIMVGEIRDNETADIAVNAAMTGHLLLSTLHANDAATTFPRLIEMGIEPFLVASSLILVAAQRLVRRVCERCRMSYFLTKQELEMLKVDISLVELVKELSKKEDISQVRFYRGSGCKSCGDTGYSGRTGIFEVIEIADPLKALISQKVPSGVIGKEAVRLGTTSMLYDGINKAFQGVTTLEEIIRAVK